MAFTMVPRPTPAGRRAGIDFLPETKGDLDAALASRHAMERIAPRPPRPAALIEKVRIVGEVTGADMALWELCVSVAQRDGLDIEQHRVPVSDALRYLGAAARRPALLKSLRRLRKAALDFDLVSDEQVREFGEVPMLVAHVVEGTGRDDLAFTIPEPVRRLLLKPARFTYIELAALPHLRSRYTVALYQRLALRAGSTYKDNRPGQLGEIAGYAWEIAPQALAEELGWRRSGGWHYGVFRREVLQPALRDLAAVRRFETELEEIRARTRGRPVQLLRFRVCPLPPDWRELRTPKADERILLELSRPDRRDLSVPAKLWLRAGAWLGAPAIRLRQAWLLAVDEAETSIPLTERHDDRLFRGPKLLAALRSRPAADVAWAFITEEARLPDILDQLGNLWAEHGGDAERARYGRQRLDRATPEQRARWDAKAKHKARAAEREREDEWALARRIVIAVDEEDEPTAAQAIERVRGEADEWTGGRGTPVSLVFRIGGHVVEDPTPRFPSEDQITVLRVIPGVLDVFLDRVDEDATTATPDLDPEPEPAAEEVDYPADLRAWAESGPYEMVTRLLHSYAAGLGRNAKYGPAVRQKAISLLRQAKAAIDRNPDDTMALVKTCTKDPRFEVDAHEINPDEYE